MHLLAEIADKMPTVAELWLWAASLSAPLALVAATHGWSAVAMLPLAVATSLVLVRGAYHEAFLEGSFSNSVWRELGRTWIAHSLASCVVPPATVAVVAFGKWRGIRTCGPSEGEIDR